MSKYILLSSFFLFFLFSCDEVVKEDPNEYIPIDTTIIVPDVANTPTKSILTILDVNKGTSWVAFESEMHLEAPNWSPDGKYLIFNSKGKLYRLELYSDALPEEIPTDFANNCNNDHVCSFDGKKIGISHQDDVKNLSRIYIVPFLGGEPKLITEKGPSYLHGWSPDGNKLVYCAERKGEFDVYSIGIEGKNETQLTNSKGLDDGPEYSRDGKFIYFNSVRSGKMQIWRMDADGANPTQITKSNTNDWFPHVSPNNLKIVYLSYDSTVTAHPANKEVELRIMNRSDYVSKPLLKLFGGQGSINVNSWSPDSKKIAFVVYEPLKSGI